MQFLKMLYEFPKWYIYKTTIWVPANTLSEEHMLKE